MLTVYKASAGSGKTFRLVVEYLKLLLKNDQNYRRILAVTFTNKATAEMKERVVEQLGQLARRLDSPYKAILLQETGLTETALEQKAARALENILFDYNRFSVSTIDKFTQRVLKAFNREIGAAPNYQLELDQSLITEEAVDRLVAGVNENPRLREWLESFITEKIRDNKSFSIEKDLEKLGSELFKERLQERLFEISNFFAEENQAKKYLTLLNETIFRFENFLKKEGESFLQIIAQNGIAVDDFSYGKSGVAGFLFKLAGNEIPDELPTRVLQAAESPEKWVAQKHPDRRRIIALAETRLLPLLLNICHYYNQNRCSYFTAKTIKHDWYTLGVLVDLNNEITALSREKGILPIASSNLLLKTIIGGNDSPFIYEKIGNAFNHFMLDEFQDTSGMQWENFRPLVLNSMAAGNHNLVVGDVKQSIYRWRNSNWKILGSQVFQDFPGFPVNEVTLGTNFRSHEKIIAFNNLFFHHFCQTVAGHEKLKEQEAYRKIIENIYSDAVQEVSPRNTGSGGLVKIELLEDENSSFEELTLERLAEQVKQLQDQGFGARDIAILIRKKDQGVRIVRHFLQEAAKPENRAYNLTVLSGESLFLKASAGVVFVVSVIRHLTHPDDAVARATMLYHYRQLTGAPEPAGQAPDSNFEAAFAALFAGPLKKIRAAAFNSSIDETITRIGAEFGLFRLKAELPFLQALIDKAAELRKSSSNDLSGFLLWWEEKGSEVSVAVNDGVDAIRLLTIHKSKGLEFKAVLIPFFNWNIEENSKKPILWCSPSEPPFNQAPLVPVSYAAGLVRTIFADDYYEELFNTLVDHLNLVYVAFTRAISVLWVNAPATSDKNRINFYLKETLQQLRTDTENHSGEPDLVFEYGELPRLSQTAVPEKAEPPAEYFFHDFSPRLTLRTSGDDFLVTDPAGTSKKNTGKIIHEILAEIKTAADLERACQLAMAQGKVDPAEMPGLRRKIEEMITHPEASRWFTGEYTVLTERELLTGRHTLRPDRMMLKAGEAVVVDFKSGQHFHESYRRQVELYAQTLSETGIPQVEGYLWFVQTNRLEKVCELR